MESIGGSYYFLDETALGRQEDWEEPKGRAESAHSAVPDFAVADGGHMTDVSGGGFSKARLERVHDVHGGLRRAGRAARARVAGQPAGRDARRCDRNATRSAGERPMQRDTIFRISSMTKPITAVAAMILVEECKLRLDEPVDELLPELADRQVLKRLDGPLDDTVPADRPITVRDLLTFRLGFGLVMAAPGTYPIADALDRARCSARDRPSPATPPEPDEWMRRLGTLPLHAPARRAVDVQHRLRRAGRVDRARARAAVRDVPARAHLRAAGHDATPASACRPPSSTGSRRAT